MQLEGTFGQMSFAEVLAEVAQKRGTGLLTFESRKNKVELDWINGKIVHVVQRPAPVAGNLGDLLVVIGEITPNQLTQAITQQRRSLSPLGQILVKLFHCDSRKIRVVLRVQAIETLYDLFSWRDAKFEFKHGIVDRKGGNSFEPIDVNAFLTKAIEALDVWPDVVKELSSPDLIIQSVGSSLPEGLFSADEHKVFDFIQKRERSFRELSIVTGMGQFVVGKTLLRLLEERLIYLRQPEKPKIEWSRLLFGGSILDFAVWCLAMAILVGAGTYLLAFAPYSPLRMIQPRHSYKIINPHWPGAVSHWRLRRVRKAIKMYHIQNGVYPASLKELVKTNWLASDMLEVPGGASFRYKRTKRYYVLDTTVR